ncbi:MAG: ABC transporter ATP-binding protein [Roseburia sp.]|nr:ABC transporter ATP-binding protein [Roseburia sp.]
MERILASGIESAYGRKTVLAGVSLAADAGQCVGIVGANGCGKSTLLNILAGLRDAKAGDIFFDGQKAQGRAARRLFQGYTGYVPQESSLIPELSVRDNLLIWYRDRRLLEQELQEGFLRILGVDRMLPLKAGKLSGGMKKRVSIGCALAGRPPILILDEPDAALDLPGKADIRSYLILYKQQGGTILLATHEESDLDICDKLYALKGGKSEELDRTLRGEELIKRMNNKE